MVSNLFGIANVQDARIIHQYIESTEATDSFPECSVNIRSDDDISLDNQAAPPNFLCGTFKQNLAPANQPHTRTFPCKGGGNGSAYTGAGTCDESDFILQATVH